MEEKKLADIAVGGKGRVLGFAKGSEAYRQKLLAMGLIKGVQFEVMRVAPMGDPVEIRVRDYNLSLRTEEARALRVEEAA
ncbi:MAG TPA: ferrous iron transport protein A [Desulfobulbaceae bacterium]|nr:ferrous iron transport protein A [Desulfobulbaceae bacterium]